MAGWQHAIMTSETEYLHSHMTAAGLTRRHARLETDYGRCDHSEVVAVVAVGMGCSAVFGLGGVRVNCGGALLLVSSSES